MNITNKDWPWYVIGLILVAITLCVFIANGNTWATQILAACLGAIITVIVTRLLLSKQAELDDKRQKQQAEAEQMRQRQQAEADRMLQRQQAEADEKLKDLEVRSAKELKEAEEKSKQSLEKYSAKLKVYSEFVSEMYEILSDGIVKREEFNDLRIELFGKVSFYASDKVLDDIKQELDNIKDPVAYQQKFPRVFSNITDILRKDLFNDSSSANKVETEKSVMTLWNAFEDIINAYPEKDENNENEIVVQESIPKGDDTESPTCLNNTFWHFAMWGSEQFKALSEGIYELNLVEYGEEWRTNLIGQVKKDDLVFLFRSGGPGYMGVFRAVGWRLFEFNENNEDKETVCYFGSDPKEISKEQVAEDIKKHDIYESKEDGATLCSSLIVEPLAFARNGIGNPGGTYRRTISRYDHGYGLKQLARFMAIMNDDKVYNVFYNEDGEAKDMGCNKEKFEQILKSGNIQPAQRDKNGYWQD